jgi:hypothetical protein
MLAAEDFAAMVSRALSTDRAVNQTLTVYGPEAYTIPAALRINLAAWCSRRVAT